MKTKNQVRRQRRKEGRKGCVPWQVEGTRIATDIYEERVSGHKTEREARRAKKAREALAMMAALSMNSPSSSPMVEDEEATEATPESSDNQ